MNQNKIFCRQQGHQQFEVNHICTYRWCSKSRWCCSLCLSDKIHDHLISKNHIINLAELPDKVKYDIEKLMKDYLNSEQVIVIKNLLSQLVKEIQELEKNIVQFRQNFERLLNNLISDDDYFNLQSLLNQVEGQYFLQLNDEDINKLFNINEYKFQTNIQLQLQDKLDKIEKKINRVLQKLKDQQENINGKNYEIQKIQQLEEYGKEFMKSSAMDKKEQYLVYNFDYHINVYDIKMKRICKTIEQKNVLSNFQFTTDSKQFFASDYYGFVYGYFVLKGFKVFYKQYIHQLEIKQIIIQKQYLITASKDKTIIKTDFIKKTQIFKLVGHIRPVRCIDYDNSKDILISTSSDNTIKVWDCVNQRILIDFADTTDYQDILLMNNNQDIICKSKGELWKFTIDYKYKKLLKFHFYKDDKQILRFKQVKNDQIIVICPWYTKVLNKRMELTHIFQHTIKLGSNQQLIYNLIILGFKINRISHQQQLDNLNYIILQDSKLLFYKISLLIMSSTSQELELKLKYNKYIIIKFILKKLYSITILNNFQTKNQMQ